MDFYICLIQINIYLAKQTGCKNVLEKQASVLLQEKKTISGETFSVISPKEGRPKSVSLNTSSDKVSNKIRKSNLFDIQKDLSLNDRKTLTLARHIMKKDY